MTTIKGKLWLLVFLLCLMFPLNVFSLSPNETDLTVVNPLQLTPSNPISGQMVMAEFIVRNDGAQVAELDKIGVGARGPGCEDWECDNYQDFLFHENVTIFPGETHVYSEQRQFQEDGSYFAQISYDSPPSAWNFLGERVDFDVRPGLQVTSDLALTPSTPESSDLVFAEFELRNASDTVLSFSRIGVGARGPDCAPFDWGCSLNVDFLYDEQVLMNPGETRRFFSWRTFEPGLYFAQISVEDTMGNWDHYGSQVVFMVQPVTYQPRTSEWQLGACIQEIVDPNDPRISLARYTGADVMRLGISWRLLEESSKGDWDYSWYIPTLNQIINKALSQDLDVFVLFLQVPCWASSDPNKDCSNHQWDDAYPPADFEDYSDAFRKVVQLFGDRVKVWEVWNEPNIARFWKPLPDAAAYTQLLQETYSVIKSQDPSAVILGGSLAGADTLFLYSMYENGAKLYFDALSFHPYSANPPDDCSDPRWAYGCGVDAIRSMMLYYNDPKDIWFTEFGWSSYTGQNGVGEENQKLYLQSALEMLEFWDFVKVATWYNLVDTEYINLPPERENENYMGLYDRDLRAKPAAIWLRESRFPYKIFLPNIQN